MIIITDFIRALIWITFWLPKKIKEHLYITGEIILSYLRNSTNHKAGAPPTGIKYNNLDFDAIRGTSLYPFRSCRHS